MESQLTLAELSLELVNQGFSAELRHSDHYADGRYLRLVQCGVYLTVEHAGSSEYLVRADAELQLALMAVCDLLLQACVAARMVGKFEVYDENDRLLHECMLGR